MRRPPTSTLFPYTTLFRSARISVRSRPRTVRGILSSRERALMPRHSPYRIELTTEERVVLESLARSYTLPYWRSEEHTSELQSHSDLVCRLLLEKKKVAVD